MSRIFKDFDLSSFWKDSDYARKKYVEDFPSDALIASVESELEVKLPASYVELMKTQNGGIPHNSNFPTTSPTSWAEDHIAISGIMGIGRKKTYSLCGSLGSQFMQEEWEYPKLGICICHCPSAGHDMVMLDYRKCGNQGEPEVVHVDQEDDYKVTFLADTFEAFVRGLVNESVYDTSEQDKINALNTIETGAFSDSLSKMIKKANEPSFDQIIRNICRKILDEKGYFALHADELSYLMYDVQFYLSSLSGAARSKDAFLAYYPKIIALSGEFSTGGYGPDFVKDWLNTRLSSGQIVQGPRGGLEFHSTYLIEFKSRTTYFK